ncbi:MAG: DcaP family trimeric outer membrane transporter [Sedimentisphaeraceae bacterium JB056]
MKSKIVLAILCCVFMANAATPEELEKENELLKARVEKLENDIAQIKEMLMTQNSAATVEKAEITAKETSVEKTIAKDQKSAAIEKLNNETIEKLLALADEKPVEREVKPSDIDLDIYGFMRYDMAYDNSDVQSFFGGAGNGWALPENMDNNDDSFESTARVSRFGIKAQCESENGMLVNGVIEVDFCGGGSESSSELRMRHGYVKLDWPDSGFSLLAGQTWDVISPLYPTMVDAAVGWFSGNIGFRRPQLRLTQICQLNEDSSLELTGAISRPADDSTYPTGTSSGPDSGQPNVQSRIALTAPMFFNKKATLGLSGHFGKDEHDFNTGGDEEQESWSFNVDFAQPINEQFTFKGEFFTGDNLDSYLGGINQGVNRTTLEEIESVGGWASICYKPLKKWLFNVGVAIEDLNSEDLNTGDREYNQSTFANCIYLLDKHVSTGLELQHNRTEYKDSTNGNSTRAQMMIMYSF